MHLSEAMNRNVCDEVEEFEYVWIEHIDMGYAQVWAWGGGKHMGTMKCGPVTHWMAAVDAAKKLVAELAYHGSTVRFLGSSCEEFAVNIIKAKWGYSDPGCGPEPMPKDEHIVWVEPDGEGYSARFNKKGETHLEWAGYASTPEEALQRYKDRQEKWATHTYIGVMDNLDAQSRCIAWNTEAK